MGLKLKPKTQKIAHISLHELIIYIFVSIYEKEIEHYPRFYFFTRKRAKAASKNIKLSNSPNLINNFIHSET